MKIELNKFYKTRSDRKARIYAIEKDKEGRTIIHGAILGDTGWKMQAWFPDGKADSMISFYNGDDIISEWQEPKPHLYAWLNRVPSGEYYVVLSEREKEPVFGDEYDKTHWHRAPWLDSPEEK